MSRIDQQQLLKPSLLDRLIDDDPTGPAESPKGRFLNLRDLKHSVLRDLENLLNTRWRCTSWPEDLKQLENSVVNYGLPDLSSENFGDVRKKDQFRQTIEKTIKRFETRLEHVRVNVVPGPDRLDRTLRFHIRATLRAETTSEEVTYESTVEPTSGIFQVVTAST